MSGEDKTKTIQASGANGKAEGQHPTPMLDQLEGGPWPSFVTGLKRLRDSTGKQYAPMMNDLLGQLVTPVIAFDGEF